MVGQKDHGSSDCEPPPEPLFVRVIHHVGTNDAPVNNLLTNGRDANISYT